MKLLQTVPALPVSDITNGARFFQEKLGFTLGAQKDDFAKLERDDVEIHLWLAGDESWRGRDGSSPVVCGAESFLAGTGSCRVRVQGIDDLYRKFKGDGILHGNGALGDTPWGTREFSVVDPDNNLITFFERPAPDTVIE